MADNVTSRRPFLQWLNATAKRFRPGGDQIHFNVLKELISGRFYTDDDTLATTRAENITRAVYEWKQYAAPVTITGLEMAKNNGSAMIENLVTTRIEGAILAAAEDVGGSTAGVFSSLTESDIGTGFTGAQSLISATPTTGTVGNINRANVTAWRNQTDSVTTGFTTDGIASMRSLFSQCKFGTDSPDLIVLTRATFLNYWGIFNADINYNQPSTPATARTSVLDVGANEVSFMGIPVIYDDACPAQRGYFINSKYWHWIVHEDRDFDLGEFVQPRDGDSITAQIYLMAEQCTDGMRYQGALIGNPDTSA